MHVLNFLMHVLNFVPCPELCLNFLNFLNFGPNTMTRLMPRPLITSKVHLLPPIPRHKMTVASQSGRIVTSAYQPFNWKISGDPTCQNL